jgi:RNA polymerase sigma-70 factor (ECF subfamily)
MASPFAWTLSTSWPAMSSADVQLTQLDDAALVSACVEGRPGAFDLVIERHQRSVYQVCYRFVGNHEDASDLAQDVFLRAYRALRRFRGQASLSTWLYRIAVNVSLNRVSSKAPLARAALPLDVHEFADERCEPAPDRLMREQRGARVRQAIARLPKKQRVTLVLRMYHEMSHQEIAEVLGSSVGAAKANLFHALNNLKRQLGEDL